VCGIRAFHSSTSPSSKLSSATRVRVPPLPPAAGAKCFAAVSICDQSMLRLDAYPEFGASGCDIQLAFDASGLKFSDPVNAS
jgi:hypothetical protein